MSSFFPLSPPAHSFFIGPTVINIHRRASVAAAATVVRAHWQVQTFENRDFKELEIEFDDLNHHDDATVTVLAPG